MSLTAEQKNKVELAYKELGVYRELLSNNPRLVLPQVLKPASDLLSGVDKMGFEAQRYFLSLDNIFLLKRPCSS